MDQQYYLKYYPDNKDILKSLFEDKKIRFTQPWCFNDPLEFNPKFNFKIDSINPYISYNYKGFPLYSLESFTKMLLVEARANQVGILSLTINSKSFDMWNMYSNGHKGFLLEFRPDFNQHQSLKPKNSHDFYPVLPVNYISKNVIDITEIIRFDKLDLFKHVDNHLLFFKSDRWKKEKEYRMIKPLSESSNYKKIENSVFRDDALYLFDLPTEVIRKIAFGAHMSIENKKYIIENCQGYDIDFLQEVIIKDEIGDDGFEGNIEYVAIGNRPKQIPLDLIYEAYPQSFCFTRKGFIHIKNKDIKSLNELPYFNGNEIVINKLMVAMEKPGK